MSGEAPERAGACAQRARGEDLENTDDARAAYYTKSHRDFAMKVREFVDRELAPFQDQWVKEKRQYPFELHEKAYKAGISGILYPKEFGGCASWKARRALSGRD